MSVGEKRVVRLRDVLDLEREAEWLESKCEELALDVEEKHYELEEVTAKVKEQKKFLKALIRDSHAASGLQYDITGLSDD